MCFSKALSLSPRMRMTSNIIFISILYVLARMVFCQAHLLKKKKRSARTWCPPIISLCTSQTNWKQKAIKNKDKKVRNNPLKSLEWFYAENCSTTHLILERWLDVEKRQSWSFWKGHSKAKWSKKVCFESEH